MARPIWTGTIAFGLVSVPVKLYSAIEQKDVGFHQVDSKTKARVRYKRVSEKTGREVPYEQISKGYELDNGRYVVIEPDELAEMDPKATKTFDIEDFVDLDEIDPIYFENSYYLAPGAGGEKAYTLLRKALEDTGRIGIGRVVMRTKQYLAAIRPYGRALAMHTMLFPDEVRAVDEIDALPDRAPRVNERELKMAKQLVDSLTTDFDPDKYHDTYREKLLDFIHKRAKGKTVEVEEQESGAVLDLLEALKRSVDGGGKAGAKDLGEQPVEELQELAKRAGIRGRSKMSKKELVRALKKAS